MHTHTHDSTLKVSSLILIKVYVVEYNWKNLEAEFLE
jgi:hypothetical protein